MKALYTVALPRLALKVEHVISKGVACESVKGLVQAYIELTNWALKLHLV